jgi:SAM-dependent methyltransferase
MDQTGSIRRQFGAAARRYAKSSYHSRSPDLAALLALAAPAGRERVLDLGTGTGHTALAFAARVSEVVGLDLTEPMLAEARALARAQGAANARFVLGDAMALDFPDACFDLVTCRVCAHHFADPGRALAQAARVLRPGGRLLLVDSVAPEDPAQDTFLNCIELLRDPSHVRNYSVSQWLALLGAAGLEPAWHETFHVPLDFDDWVERMGTPEATRAQLRALFAAAPDAVRAAFRLRTGEDAGFDIPIALLSGRRRT